MIILNGEQTIMQAWIVNNNILLGTKEELVKYISAENLLEPPYPLAGTPIVNLKEYLQQHGLQAQINALGEALDDLKGQEAELADRLKEVRYRIGPMQRKLADLELQYDAI